MADGTKIEWADATLNYANGCSLASPGCTNCYAMKQAHRFPVRQGLTVQSKGGMVWTGEVRINDKALEQALAWKRGRRIFWNAHGDLFHEKVTDEQIDRLFAVCALTPQHTHMILTKRSARMREYMASERNAFALAASTGYLLGKAGASLSTPHNLKLPLPNVWLGVSVEDQQRADERIPDLLATPAAVRFISAEPLLGPVNIADAMTTDASLEVLFDKHAGDAPSDPRGSLHWVIVGGESGPKARPMHPDWARSLRDQCQAAGVAFLHKQNGEFAPGEIAAAYLDPQRAALGLSYFGNGMWDEVWSEADGHVDDEPDVYRLGKKRAGRLLDGREWSEFPA